MDINNNDNDIVTSSGKRIMIDTGRLSGILQNLIGLKSRLEQFVDTQQNIKTRMHNAWGGTSGDKANEKLEIYSKKYPAYLKMLNKRINFLKAVIDAYSAWDYNINKKIDENFGNKK